MGDMPGTRTMLAVVALTAVRCAFALNPDLDVSQYAHASWRYRDGFARGGIQDMAQTPDGYLWLGTRLGLLRFDGVRAVAWEPPADQSGKAQALPSSYISKLLAARDGTLWIGTRGGLASWKDGKLTQYAELAALQVEVMLEDREGSLWVGAYDLPIGKLCEIAKSSVRCDPEFHESSPFGLHEDRKGNLWVGSEKGLWRWEPGPPKLFDLPQSGGVQGIVDADDGGVLVSATDGIKRLVDGKFEMAFPLPPALRGLERQILRDRDGALWAATNGGGLVHIHRGKLDVFSRSDGLTGDHVDNLFEDREGSIWVSTSNGLDRFRELPVVTYSAGQGISGAAGAVLAARDGRVWFSSGGLHRLNHGEVTAYRQHGTTEPSKVREIHGSGVPEHIASLFRDSRGRIWVAGLEGVGYLEGDRFVRSAAPGGQISTLTEDPAGNLWIPYTDRGLFHLSPDNEVQQFPWSSVGPNDPAIPLADPASGGLWLGFRKGGVSYFRDGQVRASYSAAGGLARGQVNQLRLDRQGALWIATDGGLSRLKDNRVVTLTSKDGLPCDSVQWSMEDDAQSLWLGMPCGLARVARSELDAWATADGKLGRMIQTTVFDDSDGARMPGAVGGQGPHVDKSPDGKLWFGTNEGLDVVDPRHLPFNNLPPPVQIEQIKADGKIFGTASVQRLPALVRELEIDYTALSLVAPEKNRFKYRLEGHDPDWIDAGTRRQAFYNDLAPRSYRFRVIASNNSGVWNETGDTLEFSIAPAYYQTRWFQAVCGLAGLALLWGLYRFRLYQLSREFNISLEARVSERTRLARDLHDTLLQSFQGLMLRWQVVDDQIPPGKLKEQFEQTLERADQAIAEGRTAVYDLRSSATITNELAEAVQTLGNELAAENPAVFRLTVEGPSRELHPIIRDEIYRIAIEALRNAFHHANAQHIEAELAYGERVFRLRIRDDGKGIPSGMLEQGRAGHYGLAGMRERAQRIGGKLEIWSGAGTGTEIELTLAARLAYKPAGALFRFFQRKAG